MSAGTCTHPPTRMALCPPCAEGSGSYAYMTTLRAEPSIRWTKSSACPASDADDPLRRPELSSHADSVDLADARLQHLGREEWHLAPDDDWFTTVGHSAGWRLCCAKLAATRPVLTHAARKGPWVGSRGGFLADAEIARVQGIDLHSWVWPDPGFLRPALGNSMSATLVHRLLVRLVAVATGDVRLPDLCETGERQRQLLQLALRPERMLRTAVVQLDRWFRPRAAL